VISEIGIPVWFGERTNGEASGGHPQPWNLSGGLGPHVEEAGQKQQPFALGGRERGGDFQLPGNLCRPARPSQVCRPERRAIPTIASSAASPCCGPSRSVIATARLSATTGLAATDPSRSQYSMRGCLYYRCCSALRRSGWSAAGDLGTPGTGPAPGMPSLPQPALIRQQT
jgi:hypothetical protein